MRITTRAREWYKRKYGVIEKPLYSSKLYRPEESWTKDYVWFIQVPIKTIEENKGSSICILCQKKLGGNDFYVLKVPCKFLLKRIAGFDKIKEARLALYFSPDEKNFFREIRGESKIHFDQFLIN